MTLREIASWRKSGQVLQTAPQPTHIIRVLGATIRDPGQKTLEESFHMPKAKKKAAKKKVAKKAAKRKKK